MTKVKTFPDEIWWKHIMRTMSPVIVSEERASTMCNRTVEEFREEYVKTGLIPAHRRITGDFEYSLIDIYPVLNEKYHT